MLVRTLALTLAAACSWCPRGSPATRGTRPLHPAAGPDVQQPARRPDQQRAIFRTIIRSINSVARGRATIKIFSLELPDRRGRRRAAARPAPRRDGPAAHGRHATTTEHRQPAVPPAAQRPAPRQPAPPAEAQQLGAAVPGHLPGDGRARPTPSSSCSPTSGRVQRVVMQGSANFTDRLDQQPVERHLHPHPQQEGLEVLQPDLPAGRHGTGRSRQPFASTSSSARPG